MVPTTPTPAGAGPRPRLDTRTLWTLLAGNALTTTGIGFFLPILPLFVRGRGGAPALIGLIFAAGVIGRAIAQYPGGWLADRVGRRPMLVGALVAYALVFPLYLLPVPPEALIAVRMVQAIAGGAFQPAALALAADLTPPDRRGRVFSQLRGSDTLGLLLGPALGGVVAGFRLEYVFGAGALLCLCGALLLTRLPGVRPTVSADPESGDAVSIRPLRILRLLVPALVLGAPISWTYGAYDTVWSLFLTSHGASTVVVGLSFALYALPIVVFAGLAGGIADRLGARRAGQLTLVGHGIMAGSYPFIENVAALVLLGVAEGAVTGAGVPALNAETSRLAPPGAQGRTQGIYQLGLNLAMVAGTLVSGVLYGLNPAFAFWAVSATCVIGVAGSVFTGRGARSR